MQRILTAAEMREADRLTIEQQGIPGIVLMENAASRAVELLGEKFDLARERVLVLCGKGNNGGDGLAIARQLFLRGLAPDLEAVLCGGPESLKGDALVNWRMLAAVGFTARTAASLDEWIALRPRTLRATLVVDALLGTGLSGPAHGLLGEVIADLGAHFRHARFVAVDIPSGMPSDEAAGGGPIAPADYTVTFTAPKPAQVFHPNAGRVGELRVGRIGTSETLLGSLPGPALSLAEARDFASLFEPREPASHKGSFGHVAIVGGSRAKAGAVIMAGSAAARIGAGLTTVITAQSACPAVVARTPELMTLPVPELQDGSMGAALFSVEWFSRATVAAIGPGLGIEAENRRLVERILRETQLPLVVDADGLTALAYALEKGWRTSARTLVLTPHPGEMARLTGLTVKEIEANRVRTAREFAQRRNVWLVLKGAQTVTACPDGRAIVNPTGTPALAKGGSGDVLTGLIAGMLAQFPSEPVERAVCAAVYLHGLAAERAAARWGDKFPLASDVLDCLPEAIAALK